MEQAEIKARALIEKFKKYTMVFTFEIYKGERLLQQQI